MVTVTIDPSEELDTPVGSSIIRISKKTIQKLYKIAKIIIGIEETVYAEEHNRNKIPYHFLALASLEESSVILSML